MTRIVITSKVGSDGVLQLALPLGQAEANRDVQIIVEPLASPTWSQEAWRNFVLSTAGSIPDPSFQRGEQGAYEEREPLS